MSFIYTAHLVLHMVEPGYALESGGNSLFTYQHVVA